MATEKVEVFRTSYTEVLTALKHQDDKLNRMLTALAFLTAAGVAIFVQVDSVVQFDHRGPSVGAILFVVFVGAVALALLSALSAIGPGKPLDAEGNGRPSLLFYPQIARDDWTAMRRKSPRELEQLLVKNYHSEARDIAYRVRYKVARARESSAFVQLAIVSLMLLGVFQAQPLSATTRWWIASGLIIVVLLGPFLELAQMRRYKYGGARAGPIYVWLAFAVIFVAGLLVWAQVTTDDYWVALASGLVVLGLSRLAIVSSAAAMIFVQVATVGAGGALIIAMLTS